MPDRTDTPILICQIEPPQDTDGGDYYYRTHAPGLAMAREEGVHVVNLTNDHRNKFEILEQADVLVLKDICDPDYLPLIERRKKKHKPTVYEIADDLGAVPPWNPLYFFYKNPDNLALVHRLISYCDALQVTCEELRRLYGRLNSRCEVFPNAVSHVPRERTRGKKETFILGWGGSHGHLEDMAEIAAPLTDWVLSRPSVRLHLMCSDPIWDLFKEIPAHKKRHFSTGSIRDYYRFLSTLDIGIAPLKDTPFNRSRSDVKFLEYAVSGVVPVVRDLPPYGNTVVDGDNGFLFKDSREMVAVLDLLLKDPALMERTAKAARRYVLKYRLQSLQTPSRITFYRGLLGKSRAVPVIQTQPKRDLFARWAEMEGALRRGRHLKLESTRFEHLLHDGLVAMQIEEDTVLARRFFEEAKSLEPKNYQPYLLGAPVSSDPIRSLQKALELKPDSLKAWIMLGDRLAGMGKIHEALSCYNSAVGIFSEYDLPYRKAGELLRGIGEETPSHILFEKASLFALPMPAREYPSECNGLPSKGPGMEGQALG
ncbi:MAG: glycosyltransferase [Deltaproteobacteria bacterium]|nr:glycosyltransferase [Deltaproteobacteria bacterium]MBW2130856.1 glycosyltransferase [Deltaproteobacteria bacterium]